MNVPTVPALVLDAARKGTVGVEQIAVANDGRALDSVPNASRVVAYVLRNLLSVPRDGIDAALARTIVDPEWTEARALLFQEIRATQPPAGPDGVRLDAIERRVGKMHVDPLSAALEAVSMLPAIPEKVTLRPELPIAWLRFPECEADPRVPDDVCDALRAAELWFPAALAAVLASASADSGPSGILLVSDYVERASNYIRESYNFIVWYFGVKREPLQPSRDWEEFFRRRKQRIAVGRQAVRAEVETTGGTVDLRKLLGGGS